MVYRVQAADGRGPWRPGFSDHWFDLEMSRSVAELYALQSWIDEFPHVMRQRDPKSRMHLGCGCLTIEQLRRWFTVHDYSRLQSWGYKAVLMDVDRILASSDLQCVFERAKPLQSGIAPVDLYGP